MNHSLKKIDRTYETCRKNGVIEIDSTTRFVFMSDCHRGNGGRSDDFAHNRLIFLHALAHYRKGGYTFCEVGDGEELWENGSFDVIRWAYSDLYIRLGYMHAAGRFILLWGNHNNFWRKQERVRRHYMPALWQYFDGRPSPLLESLDPELLQCVVSAGGEGQGCPAHPIFKDLRSSEGIILRHRVTNRDIFVIHGHQGEFWSDSSWRISRFLVRRVWRFLQNAGLRPRITPAGNYALMKVVEGRLTQWSRTANVPLIAGHTHQPEFSAPGFTAYFNCGSCVHPGCITAIEIEDDHIALVKWHVSTFPAEGEGEGAELRVVKTVLEGPEPLSAYLRG